MNLLTAMIVLALLATVVALISGVAAMVRGGEFDRRHGTELMLARVGFQGFAVLVLLLALYAAGG